MITDDMSAILRQQDPIPDRYSPDMEAQRIFDKMFEVDAKKSYIVDGHDSPRHGYDIDASASDCEEPYRQVKSSARIRSFVRSTPVPWTDRKWFRRGLTLAFRVLRFRTSNGKKPNTYKITWFLLHIHILNIVL